MMEGKISLLCVVLFTGLLGNFARGEQCGSRSCKAGEVCESNVDGGTCYNRSSRTDCSDGLSYCYKPRQCCGISTCCPARSECCGFNTCCPEGAVCCGAPSYCCERGTTCCGFQTCCASGSHCDGGMCKAYGGGPFKWWYIGFFLAPVSVLFAVLIRRRRRAAALRAAGISSGGVVVAVPAQTTTHYGYDQGPINYGMPVAGAVPQTDYDGSGKTTNPSCPPPAYDDVVNPQA